MHQLGVVFLVLALSDSLSLLVKSQTLYTPPPVLSNIPSPAKLEPTTGHYLGAWLDSQENATDFDTPERINARLGYNLGIFHFAQNIPVGETEAPVDKLLNSTDAMLFLTVYARQGLNNETVTDSDLQALANQCANYNRQGRKVLLRYCPEMNGGWAIYGQKANTYVTQWRRMATAIRSVAPETALLWSPNSAAGYPFAGGEFSANVGDLEFGYIDTNGDGLLTSEDEPYLPYYPGDDWVDWVGMSIYYYGIDYPWVVNQVPPVTRFHDILTGVYTGPGFPPATVPNDFYQEFSVTRNKPFFNSEISAAFHVARITPPIGPISPGPGEVAIKQAWWRQQITNETFFQAYPKVKGFALFEFLKDEEDTLRDFRLTWPNGNGTGTLNEFKADLQLVASNYVWAKSSAGSTPVTESSGGSTQPSPSPFQTSPLVVNTSNGFSKVERSTLWIVSFSIFFVGWFTI